MGLQVNEAQQSAEAVERLQARLSAVEGQVRPSGLHSTNRLALPAHLNSCLAQSNTSPHPVNTYIHAQTTSIRRPSFPSSSLQLGRTEELAAQLSAHQALRAEALTEIANCHTQLRNMEAEVAVGGNE